MKLNQLQKLIKEELQSILDGKGFYNRKQYGEPGYACSYCGVKRDSKSAMKSHIEHSHAGKTLKKEVNEEVNEEMSDGEVNESKIRGIYNPTESVKYSKKAYGSIWENGGKWGAKNSIGHVRYFRTKGIAERFSKTNLRKEYKGYKKGKPGYYA